LWKKKKQYDPGPAQDMGHREKRINLLVKARATTIKGNRKQT